MKLVTLLFLIGLVTFLGSLVYSQLNECDFIDDEIIKNEYVEKIPLYYDIDNPNIIYTIDEEYNFVEVSLNG